MARVQSVFNKLKLKLKSAQECWKCKIMLQIRKLGQCNRDMPCIRATALIRDQRLLIFSLKCGAYFNFRAALNRGQRALSQLWCLLE